MTFMWEAMHDVALEKIEADWDVANAKKYTDEVVLTIAELCRRVRERDTRLKGIRAELEALNSRPAHPQVSGTTAQVFTAALQTLSEMCNCGSGDCLPCAGKKVFLNRCGVTA